MRTTSAKDVRIFLESYLTENLREQGRDMAVDLPDDCDLLLSGVIDSVGLLELITAVQKYCDREIDFERLDPESMTVFGPLCRYISEQMGNNGTM
jgi:acyl carrier protein